jgi:hypothetical protein
MTKSNKVVHGSKSIVTVSQKEQSVIDEPYLFEID